MMALLHPATSFGPVAYLACIGYDDYPGYVGIIMIACIRRPACKQPEFMSQCLLLLLT